MELFRELGANFLTIITNRIFYVTFTAWFVAQTMKVLLDVVINKRFNFRLFVGTGGMPSSHTAAVTAGTMMIGMNTGWASPLFMVCLLYCIVVVSDAVGVRRAAGKQASILNKMLDEIGHNTFTTERLKELLGHSPMEAGAGLLIGMIIPWLMN